MSEKQTAPWVCPWGICSHEQAQECRANTLNTRRTRGCGTYFSLTTTPEEAHAQVNGATSTGGAKP